MKENIKAVIFDLDNTLYDFSKSWLRANRDMYNYLNLSPYASYEKFFAIFKKYNENILADISQGKTRLRHLRFLRIMATMKELGLNFTEEDAQKYYEKMFEFILADIREDKILTSNLTKLKSKYKIFLLTNGIAREQRLKLEKMKILDIFDGIYISSETMLNKPNSQAFLQIIENHNLRVEHTLMVGDSFYHDIVPAQKLGLQTFFIEKKWHLSDENYTYDYKGYKTNRINNVFSKLLAN
ncbi:HAD family hydrolase [Gemella sp. zg-1178]|uniref:HAD family hydrolase n=1 Tax=Gemella sp. zg-1178 TaxID=2840372 RepID=UPI001C04EEA0|nr:HAD family hydrolase [Gemella sp. zg-1178]MBU0278757.1 HAD family hydrolase [Gemella sp. zg-1178]